MKIIITLAIVLLSIGVWGGIKSNWTPCEDVRICK